MSDKIEDNPNLVQPTPKRARSAYQVFMADKKGNTPRTELNDLWKKMTDDEKEQYVKISNDEKAATKAASSSTKDKEKRKASDKKSAEKKPKVEKADKQPAKKTAVSFYIKDQASKDLALAELKLTKWDGIKCNAWLKSHYNSLSDSDKKKWIAMEDKQ